VLVLDRADVQRRELAIVSVARSRGCRGVVPRLVRDRDHGGELPSDWRSRCSRRASEERDPDDLSELRG
jgi:hypothetical protein